MKKLEDMVGEVIGAHVPSLDPTKIQNLTLHGVEAAGL
jgi:hypothetical protein